MFPYFSGFTSIWPLIHFSSRKFGSHFFPCGERFRNTGTRWPNAGESRGGEGKGLGYPGLEAGELREEGGEVVVPDVAARPHPTANSAGEPLSPK